MPGLPNGKINKNGMKNIEIILHVGEKIKNFEEEAKVNPEESKAEKEKEGGEKDCCVENR